MNDIVDEGIWTRVIGVRTVAEWDKRWQLVPDWRTADTPELRRGRGIVRFCLHGEVVAIARASDNQRGFVKKFSDYVRPSPSSRDHPMGRRIYENRRNLTAEIIVTGESQDMEQVNIALKDAMVELYAPVWLVSAIM